MLDIACDDESDHESEDELLQLQYQRACIERNAASARLVRFAENASRQIQCYFGGKIVQGDIENISTNKQTCAKSGREMYYADLLQVAEGKFVNDDGYRSKCENLDNRHKYTGRFDRKIGIGPLNKLFEFGLRKFVSDKNNKRMKGAKGRHIAITSEEYCTPMHLRKLPVSFWVEPGTESDSRKKMTCTQPDGSGIMFPDFGDLLQSWINPEHI